MFIVVVSKSSMLNSVERKRIVDGLKAVNGFDIAECEVANIPDNADCVVVFGGDGTMLDVADAICDRQIPMIGINLGNLGFLTEFDSDVDTSALVDAIIEMNISKKMLVCTYINDMPCAKALNEIVIKSDTSRPIYIDVLVDGVVVDTYHSDGAIVSTPTGSTAYALSAGGPILAPDANAFVLLPICAHSLHSRPLVISAQSNVQFCIKGDDVATICVDGKPIRKICKDEKVFVSRADIDAKFIIAGDSNFYKKLLQKMNRWSTT